MEAVRTSETSVDNHFTRQYIPEDNSEHHTRRRENLKSHKRELLLATMFWKDYIPFILRMLLRLIPNVTHLTSPPPPSLTAQE
jgi:hypothetical protein